MANVVLFHFKNGDLAGIVTGRLETDQAWPGEPERRILDSNRHVGK